MFGFLAPIIGGIGSALGIGAGATATGAAAGAAATGLGGFLSSQGGQALIKGGTQLLGGMMQRREARRDPPRVDFAALRAEAEKAGFNPLTALQATGGAGFQTGQAPVTLGSVLQSAGQTAISAYEQADPVRKEAARLDNELTRARIDALRSTAPVKAVAGATVANSSQDELSVPRSLASMTDSGQIRPRSRQDAMGVMSDGMVLVTLPDGQFERMPRKVLERIHDPKEVKNGMTIITEDFEAMFGDEFGQVVAAPRLPGAVKVNLGGLWGQSDQRTRQKDIDSPFGIQSVMPEFMMNPDRDKLNQPHMRRPKRKAN